MTTDLDAALRRLMTIDHPALASIEEGVMARVRERRHSEAVFDAPLVALVALVAITFGTAAGALSSTPAVAASPSPFGPSNPLAPSTLLAFDR